MSTSVWETRVRSYELDSFGHVNHAVHLNWFEQARFDTLEVMGYSPAVLAERGWGFHVVRVEVDYRSEGRLGDHIRISTRIETLRNSSMTLVQTAVRGDDSRTVVAAARVVVVWIGPDRKPMRIPDEVRATLEG